MPHATGARTSLREGIQQGLVRIVRLYVALSVGLLSLLAIAISHYDAVTRLSQDRELVVTRLTADLQGATRQLASLASSSLMWTGLTDSYGREAYLAPLLSRFNAGNGNRFLVLDYRGRRFLAPEGSGVARVIESEPVRRAVAEGRSAWGLLPAPNAAGSSGLPSALVLVQPVLSPQTGTAVGYIVAEYNPAIAIAELPLAPGLDITLQAGQPDTDRSGTGGLGLVSRSSLRVGQEPPGLALDVRVGRSPVGPLLRGAAVAIAIGLLGFMLSTQIQRWTREFANQMTQRLEQLVATCRDVLDGRPVNLEPQPKGDEISAVLETLHRMLHVQQQITNDLRTAARVFETSGEAIMVTDVDGRVVESNPALSRMTGYARLELIGQHAGVLYKEAENLTTSHHIRAALQHQGLWRGETTFRHRNGHLVPATVAISRLSATHAGERSGMVAVISDITALKAAQAQLHDMAYRDNLTGLPNFRALTETLQTRLAASDARARPFLVMFFDMDHLKTVNDTHGHDTGDAVIQALAAHLQSRLPPGHLLSRRSGDEFVALVDSLSDASVTALHAAMDEEFSGFEAQTPKGPIAVSFSTGVARFPHDGVSMQDLLIRADGALLQVKQGTRRAVRWVEAGSPAPSAPGTA